MKAITVQYHLKNLILQGLTSVALTTTITDAMTFDARSWLAVSQTQYTNGSATGNGYGIAFIYVVFG